MPTISKTVLLAVAATGAIASLDHQELFERELVDAIDNQLLTRNEAEHLVNIWARGDDIEPLHVTRDIIDEQIASLLISRSDIDHLDDIYSRDLEERDLQIRSDIEIAFHDHEGIFARSLEQQDAVLRVRELAARDPELFHLYRRGTKLLAAGGAIAGAMVAGKGNRLKGAAIGGVGGFVASKLGKGVKKFFSGGGHKEGKSKDKGSKEGKSNKAPKEEKSHDHGGGHGGGGGGGGGYGGGDMGGGYGGGGDYQRRDIDDPEIYYWE